MSKEYVGFGPLATEPNPCVRLYGYGPDDKTCKTCDWLQVRQKSRRYYKCWYRKETNGPGTDHRVGWRACGKWEAVGGE